MDLSDAGTAVIDRPVRIAFLISDFPTESRSGAGAFVHRFAEALRECGQIPEVFVSSDRSEVLDFYGIRVERVGPGADGHRLLRLARRAAARLGLDELFDDVTAAAALNRAFERRNADAPFDVVHFADWRATGLFVGGDTAALRVIRCSWSRDFFRRSENQPWSLQQGLLHWLELHSVRQADLAYAPSRFMADYLRRTADIPARVIRPSNRLECAPVAGPAGLPPRYLIHFGHIRYRKGSDLIARALPIAWASEPELRMVWAGPVYGVSLDEFRALWGAAADRVTYVGELERASLYGTVRQACASVLPSRADNLPNTAIESLMLGVPVIGTRNSSIDELVEPGVCGELVDIDDVEALAAAMVRAWRGEIIFERPPAVFEAMQPQAAVDALLAVCGLELGPAARSTPPARSPQIVTLHPATASAGTGFNLQPGGMSALAVQCENAGTFTALRFGGMTLPTSFGSPQLVTALIPPELVAIPGDVSVALIDGISGASNEVVFRISA